MDTDEMRNRLFLQAMLDAFEKKALSYYLTGSDPAERLTRLKNIRDEMRKLPTETIGITAGDNPALPIYPACDELTHCFGGICVDNSFFHPDAQPIMEETPFIPPPVVVREPGT